MPRKSRELSPTGVYHVMMRGINKTTIFHDDLDYMKMLKTLSVVSTAKDKNETSTLPGCAIYAYCLMPNHIHLLIGEVGETLERTIKRIGVSYAIYYNNRYERTGHLFQDRFKSEPVGDSKYYVTLLRYIHFNPVEARLAKLPSQYKWSSWHEFENPSPEHVRICAQSVPFGNADWQELRETVLQNPEIERFVSAIETERANNHAHSKFIAESLLPEGINISDIRNLAKKERNNYIIQALLAGISQQQLARILGISRPTIQRIWHKHIQK